MSRFITRSVLAGFAVLAASTVVASADTIDRRQAVQEQRIQQGLRSGEITRLEARRLEQEQARIRELERRAKADGHVDRREAAQIARAQGEASRHIYSESHDSQKRGSFFRRWW